MLLIQVLLIQVSTIIIFDNLYVQNQSTTTAQALARTKTRMTTWLNSNFRGRWKEVSGPNVTLASNQWMIVMRIGKQGGNYDYHYWYKAFHAGMECPACHRSVTEQSLPEVQAALKKVLSELYAAGSEQRAQLIELQEMDKKAADTFAQFKEDDLGKWAAEAAEMEQRCASLAEQASAETERLRAEIQTLTADLEYGNLSQSEYDHLGTCREELRQSEAKIAALQTMTAAQLPDFDREIAQANASIAEIKRKMANVIAYISKRAELTFSQLKMNRVEISLYDVVKSTGEVKDTFKFQYGGRRYDRLSLSEKIRAGMEVSELMKRLTGRNYPVFVDNMESVDDLANVRPTGQIIMAKCVSGAALQVKPIRPIAFAEQRAA